MPQEIDYFTIFTTIFIIYYTALRLRYFPTTKIIFSIKTISSS